MVPYTGAAADINLGAQTLTGSVINATTGLRVLPTYTSNWVGALSFTGNGINAQGGIILREWSTGAGKIHSIGLISGLVYAASRTITFPDADGTLVTRVNGVSANNNGVVTIPEAIQVAASDETSNLTTGTAKVTFRMPYAMTLTAVRASLSTAQTSGTLVTADINLNGTSILGTKLTFENGQKTTTTATTPATITTSALTDDGEITIDVDAIGLAGAKGLKITLIGTRV